jgi:hypothetical protein
MSELVFDISTIVRILRSAKEFNCNIFKYLMAMGRFLIDFIHYFRKNNNDNYKLSFKYSYPCLADKTTYTPIEPTYFFQDAWAASKIFCIKPKHHYDVGSSIKTLSIISQHIPTTTVDVRPVDLHLDGFLIKKGSILSLPFENNSIESLSSLCVVEHIGLGRYGDLIDPWGSEKAAKELVRVLKKGGDLLVSMPVDVECRIYFNAHRTFTREYILHLFKDLVLIEELYIYGRALFERYDTSKGFGTGLFHFKRVQ